MKLKITNPSVEGLEQSTLSSAYSAGATTIDIRNNNNFVANQKIMVGELGHERTEIVTLNTVTTPGTTFTLTGSGLVFPHDADTPVYVLKYDKVRFYRSITGIDGSYTQLGSDTPLDVDNASLRTVYDDIAGLTSYYYKVSFIGTFDSTESDLSDAIPGAGYPRGTAGFLINEFFDEVADTTQQNMTVREVIALLNEVNDDVISQSRRPYRFLKTSKLLSTTAGSKRIPLPTDLVKFDRYTYTNSFDQRTDTYDRISMNEMEYIDFDNTVAPDDNTIYVSIDESTNELVVFPAPATTGVNNIRVYYWRKFLEITSLSNVLETPNPRIYKLFLLGRYYRKRAIKEPNYLNLSDRYLSDYNTEIVKLQRSNRLDMGTPMSLKPDTHTPNGLRR